MTGRPRKRALNSIEAPYRQKVWDSPDVMRVNIELALAFDFTAL